MHHNGPDFHVWKCDILTVNNERLNEFQSWWLAITAARPNTSNCISNKELDRDNGNDQFSVYIWQEVLDATVTPAVE